MRGEHDLLVVSEQGPGHMRGADLVQTLGRLVGHNGRGGEAQRGGDGQQMPFLGIQRRGGLSRDFRQTEVGEQVADDRLPLRLGHLVLLQRLVDGFGDGGRLVVAVRDLLAPHPADDGLDALQIAFDGRVERFVAACDVHGAARGGQCAVEQFEQRGLAGPVQADESHTPLGDGQRGRFQTDIAVIVRVSGIGQRERERTRSGGGRLAAHQSVKQSHRRPLYRCKVA